jgi:hypothetical protein
MEQASQVGGILGIVVTVVGVVYSAINHKRLRSTCCGKKIDMAIDIESTSPIQSRHKPCPVETVSVAPLEIKS